MSHKYYGLQKQEESLYTVPFISTKTERLRFLNEDLVAYGNKNEFIVHKNPGLTVLRVSDRAVSQSSAQHSNTQTLMNEFLNQLVSKSNLLVENKLRSSSNRINIKQISINSKAVIQITLNAS